MLQKKEVPMSRRLGTITPEDLQLYKALKRERYLSDRWWDINSALAKALALPPWEWPGVGG